MLFQFFNNLANIGIPVPESFPPRNRNHLKKIGDKANFKLSIPPNLSYFVGSYSWLMFIELGLTDEDSVIWMKMKCSNWQKHQDFHKFERFVKSLPVVNDASERSVQLMSNYVNNVHQEDDRQDLILSTSRHRNIMKNMTTKEDMAVVYENMI